MNWRTHARALALVFVLAASVRTLHYWNWPGVCIGGDRSEAARIAESIARNGAFADPYPVATGPTAHMAPVYPFLLSLVYRLPEGTRLPARVALNILFGSLLCAAVMLAAATLGLDRQVGMTASVLLAVLPPSLPVEICNNSDTSLVGLWGVLSVAATAAWLRGRMERHAVFGIFWGCTLLAAPVYAAVFAGYLWMGLRGRIPWRKTAVVLLLSCAVLAPWTIRNRLAVGGWFLVRDTVGLELRVSNADNAYADPSVNIEKGAMRQYHPALNSAIGERVRNQGEFQVFSALGREAAGWMRANPGRFLSLSAERFRNFWIYSDISPLQPALRITLLILAVLGLTRSPAFARWTLLCFIALYSFPFALVQPVWRYRYPIEWAVVLLAVQGVSTAGSKLLAGRWQAGSSGRG